MAELEHRARPPVREQQRRCIGHRRSDVQEVDPLAVDLRRVLGKSVQPGFGLAPVEAISPVVGEPAQVADRDAASPGLAGQAGRPARPGLDVGYLLEMLSTLRVGDAGRTAAVRQRHRALIIDGLRAGSPTSLPGEPPTSQEQAQRWIPTAQAVSRRGSPARGVPAAESGRP
jgi:hypothetical protein